jgi:arginyl-tRNA synthetase
VFLKELWKNKNIIPMYNIQEKLEKNIRAALGVLSIDVDAVHLEHPSDLANGDFATNVAFVATKQADRNPQELAEQIAHILRDGKDEMIEKIEVAGPGFINFYLSPTFYLHALGEILAKNDRYGGNDELNGKKVMIEYTDPNPFKEFHAGHLMSNTIGESISRIIEFSGAEVKRANYQGDTGLHVAKALWGLLQKKSTSLNIKEIGNAYAYGTTMYEEREDAKKEIDEINVSLYKGTLEHPLSGLYEEGRRISLEHFETIYRKLGTKFDYYFFERDTGVVGMRLVEEHKDDIFEESDGAVVFRGEKYGLHTRVFVTSDEYPTYEAKELGLAEKKQGIYPHDHSITLTGNEITEYFKVVVSALSCFNKGIAEKIEHIPHGMLRLPEGKMSSRKGNVIATEALVEEVSTRVREKILDNKELDEREKDELSKVVAVGAIKYSILKNATGRDIVFDIEKSLSFEGDSGPYIQYTYARAQSVLRRAQATGTPPPLDRMPSAIGELERTLARFPEVVGRAHKEREPHHVASFAVDISQKFNAWYAKERIVGSGYEEPYRVALTFAVSTVLKNALFLLGIDAPERM